MIKMIFFVLVLTVLAVTPIQAANLNQIQQQVLQAAQDRQVPNGTASGDYAELSEKQNKLVTQTTVLNEQPIIEILWQAFDGKIKLWKLDGQLFLSIKLV